MCVLYLVFWHILSVIVLLDTYYYGPLHTPYDDNYVRIIRSGDAFFHGPYFVTPSDIEHSPTRLFYRKEVFLSAREQTNPVLSVTGRCSVLSYKEFTACRVTEIPETHVYICESKYLEAEKVVKKYNKPLKVRSRSQGCLMSLWYLKVRTVGSLMYFVVRLMVFGCLKSRSEVMGLWTCFRVRWVHG